jgi:hypothetical protein
MKKETIPARAAIIPSYSGGDSFSPRPGQGEKVLA